MELYQHVGVAAAFSPRLEGLLAEAARHAGRMAPRVSLIHAGAHTPEKEARLRRAAAAVGMPPQVDICWEEGAPDEAILRAVVREGVDLLVAGALEKERPLRYYLGSVAHNLVREAPCSLLLFTEPRVEPPPIRTIVVVTDYSETSLIAFVRAVRLAEREGTEAVHVIRILSQYGEAMVFADGVRRERAQVLHQRSMAEETALLQDFVDAAGHRGVPVVARCIEGSTGATVSRYVREVDAELLVMPSSKQSAHFFTRLFPSDMEGVLREIPCNLWVVRERWLAQ